MNVCITCYSTVYGINNYIQKQRIYTFETHILLRYNLVVVGEYDDEMSSGRVDLEAEALLRAAGKNDIAALTVALDSGTSVNATGHNGYTALILAADCGHPDAVELLLDHGASLTPTWCDFDALAYATRNKDGKPTVREEDDGALTKRNLTFEILQKAVAEKCQESSTADSQVGDALN